MPYDSLTDANFEPINVDGNGNFIFTGALLAIRRSIVGLHNKVFPVYVMNPYTNDILYSGAFSVTKANAVVYTASATRRTWITGFHLAMSSNVTADNVGTSFIGTPRTAGAQLNFATLYKNTLTAIQQAIGETFLNPVEIKQGSDLKLDNAFTVGASNVQLTVYGFVTD